MQTCGLNFLEQFDSRNGIRETFKKGINPKWDYQVYFSLFLLL